MFYRKVSPPGTGPTAPTSKFRRVVIGILMVAGLLWIVSALHPGPRLELGDQAKRILEGATRVETFRVISPMEAQSIAGEKPRIFSSTAPQVDECYITATAKEQGPRLAQKIARILLDEKAYSASVSACLIFPGVVFRVWNGAKCLDIVLCFHCGQIDTVIHDAHGKSTDGISTSMTDYSRSAFALLAKEAFPNDADIQNL